MGKTANQIETHIERTRDNLGANIHELEEKVKSATDWKHYFQKNPMTMIGMAFGGGVLLATMVGGKRRRSYSHEPASHVLAGTDRPKHVAAEALDGIKGALIGVAASRIKEFVGEVVPGFSEHYKRTRDAKSKTQTNGGALA